MNIKRFVVVTTAVPKNSLFAPDHNVFRSSAYDAEGAIMFALDSIDRGYTILDFEEV